MLDVENGQMHDFDFDGDTMTGPFASFCLDATAGRTYDIVVTLNTLEDSIMRLLGPSGEMLAENDDYGDALGCAPAPFTPAN
jgi:hypothetical protein